MDLKNLKEYKENTRIKKIDVRKWLLRGHAPLYTFILIVFAAAVVFMFSTIHSMFNNENTSDNPSDEVSVSTETTGYIADNQSYMLAINKSKNYLIVYKMDATGEFTNIFQIFRCSVPQSLATGETSITYKFIWIMFDSNVYGHYTVQFGNNAYLHSVPYTKQDTMTLIVSAYNNLGKSSSVGSVALTAADAKWIYENCGLNTKVKVYEDSTENFDNRLSELTTLAADAKYDPTDQGAVNNAENNIVNTKIAYMTGTRDCTVALNSDFDIWTGVYAKDVNNNDITSYITATGSVDTSTPGVYKVIYFLNDSFGTNLKYYRYVTVTDEAESTVPAETTAPATAAATQPAQTDTTTPAPTNSQPVTAVTEASTSSNSTNNGSDNKSQIKPTNNTGQ